jgi:hypothetical protein
VEVRFHHLESKSMEKADSAVQRHRLFKGVVSLPSRYFDASHVKINEDALASAMMLSFTQVFPREILALAVGEPVTGPPPLPAQLSVPTLFIEHGQTWSGSAVTSTNPRGVYVGLGISFEALFQLPNDTKPVKIKLDVWKTPDTAAAKGDDKPEETIYGEMRAETFALFQKKVLGAFFRAPGK